jgi:hypothetical protein
MGLLARTKFQSPVLLYSAGEYDFTTFNTKDYKSQYVVDIYQGNQQSVEG